MTFVLHKKKKNHGRFHEKLTSMTNLQRIHDFKHVLEKF